MMDCNWMVVDTEQKRRHLIECARWAHFGDLEARTIEFARIKELNREQVITEWKKL